MIEGWKVSNEACNNMKVFLNYLLILLTIFFKIVFNDFNYYFKKFLSISSVKSKQIEILLGLTVHRVISSSITICFALSVTFSERLSQLVFVILDPLSFGIYLWWLSDIFQIWVYKNLILNNFTFTKTKLIFEILIVIFRESILFGWPNCVAWAWLALFSALNQRLFFWLESDSIKLLSFLHFCYWNRCNLISWI